MTKFSISCVLTALFLCSNVNAGLFFWDTNGADPGSGSSTPGGTWGVDAFWNEDGGGAGTGTVAWGNGAVAVFAAGDDATGAYTVNVTSNLEVADIHVDLGEVTFEGGPINLNAWDDNNVDRLLSVGHKDPNAIARYNAVLTGANGIIRYKRGTLIFGATNTYSGPTKIEGGILQLGAPQVIPTNSNLVLANNNNRSDVGPEFTPVTLALDGFSQTLGALILTGPNASTARTIDFGHGNAALAFADSSAESWFSDEAEEIPLFLVNYTPGQDSLRFGTSTNGLTAAQLAQIRFVDFGNASGGIDAQGFITPVFPRILSVTRVGDNQTDLTWTSVPGHNYRLQYKEDLNDASWTDVVPDVPAVSETTTYSDSPATSDARYYRVVNVP